MGHYGCWTAARNAGVVGFVTSWRLSGLAGGSSISRRSRVGRGLRRGGAGDSRLCGRTIFIFLRVVVLDTVAVVGATHAALAALAAPATSGGDVVGLAGAAAEDDEGEEEEEPRGPDEAESIPANAGIAVVGFKRISGLDESGGHESRSDGMGSKSEEGQRRGDGGAEAAAAGKQAGEEGEDLEEEGDEEEDPAKAPEVEVGLGGRVVAVGAFKSAGDVGGVAIPGLAKGRRRTSDAAVIVVLAAEEEVGPLGDVASAGDARGVGAQEVDEVERDAVGQAGENDEPEQEKGAGKQDEPDNAQGGVLCSHGRYYLSLVFLLIFFGQF